MEDFLSSSVSNLLYIDVVRLKNETTAQCDCAKEYKCNEIEHYENRTKETTNTT